MGTDRYAYQSRLRKINPMPKLILTLIAMTICLLCGSALVGLTTLVGMGATIVCLGGLSIRVFMRFLKIPLLFLMVSCLTAMIRSFPYNTPVLIAFSLGGRLWGIDWASLYQAVDLLCIAVGVISSLLFLALNTPVADLALALRRLHIPALMIELIELIYRFIFVLTETANHIRNAQESRLGYTNWHRAVLSLGILTSMVFLRALHRADRIYRALESRGYTGALTTLPHTYLSGIWMYFLTFIITAIQILAYWVERTVLT